MSASVFLRVIDAPPEEKGDRLRELIGAVREGRFAEVANGAFTVDMPGFGAVPGSPFAYWVGDDIRRIFRTFPPLEGNAATVKQGLATADDFRFVRAWWEVAPERIGYSAADTVDGRGWVHFAKGGSYSPYYADVHLVVNWFGKGAEIKNFYHPGGRLASRPQNEDFYFRPGLTYPIKNRFKFSCKPLPEGSIFAHVGSSIFPVGDGNLPGLLAYLHAALVTYLLRAMAGWNYEVGIVQRLPSLADFTAIVRYGEEAAHCARSFDQTDETAHAYLAPSRVGLESSSVVAFGNASSPPAVRLAELEEVVDTWVFDQFGILKEQRDGIRTSVAGDRTSVAGIDSLRQGRPSDDEEDANGSSVEDVTHREANLLMWCVGAAFGRWDVRMARDASLIPALQGPFERLPRVARGALVGPDGLPARSDSIASEAWLRARPDAITLPEPDTAAGPVAITAAEYPVTVAWDGILVDDEGHPRDIVARVREVLRYVYGDRSQSIEDEALEILRGGGRTPRTLRDWFREQKAAGVGLNFFDFHVRRYSKSRRKAPIYWRLCTRPGRGTSGYAVWLYYHRLTHDTLWTVIGDYVAPRRELEERRLADLRSRRQDAQGGEARRLEQEIEAAADLLQELGWFEPELRKVATRGYAPNLDDGVVINMAPLRAVIPWSEPAAVWRKLEAGDYDWARLAMRYWPERVQPKCAADPSLAIAHGLHQGGSRNA